MNELVNIDDNVADTPIYIKVRNQPTDLAVKGTAVVTFSGCIMGRGQ